MSFIEQQKRKIAAMYGIKTVPIVIADIQKSELDNQFSGVEKPNFVGANIHEHQRNQNSHLAKSFMNTTDYLEKGGKRAMIGEVRTYAGQKWVKHSDGWVHVSDKGKVKLHTNEGKVTEGGGEEHSKHYNSHVDRKDRETGDKVNQTIPPSDGSKEDRVEEEKNYKLPTRLKELEKLGVEFVIGELKHRPVEKVKIPVNLKDREYDAINNTLDSYNLLHLKTYVRNQENI